MKSIKVSLVVKNLGDKVNTVEPCYLELSDHLIIAI